jgi:beta-glucosidase
LIANDVIHGYRTIFPIPLAMACTWDLALIEQVGFVIACEAAAAGTHWNFAPMVDICRDPRWGRVAEGAGEDPFLGTQVAKAWVRGFQAEGLPGGKRMAACVKHFAAYGAAEAGKDYNTVDMSERRLRSDYLPPYLGAVEAGVATVMTSFNELNGIPATANTFLLQNLLRDEWGFDGVVVSDYDSIGELILHGFTQDHREAGMRSVLAGVDVDMMGNAYHFYLTELVRDGRVPEACIDSAVRRILALKFRLGLFENPYIDESLAPSILMHPSHQELALKAAEASIVLLKNEAGLLPLKPEGKTVTLIGPLAGERQSLLGSWACEGLPEETTSLVDGLRKALPGNTQFITAKGCDVVGPETDFETALDAAGQADVVILALGETDWMSGEAHSRAHLGLPGRQQELLEAVAATGKPIAAILFSGRPLALPWLAEHVPAVLMAWQGGTLAGDAIANILLGRSNPSGKLTICFPRSEGQIPVYYAHKSTGRPADSIGVTQFNQAHKSTYLDETNNPLFPFGYGLSYASFSYNHLVVETPILRKDGILSLTVEISNTGDRDGQEIAQCYVRDLYGSITRPVKELKGFQKISLQAGASQTVRFEVPVSSLAFWDQHMQYRVETGDFKVWIGPDSESGLEGSFSIIE